MTNIMIKVENLNKVYKLYENPIDRLKESLNLAKKLYHKEHFALKNIEFRVNKGETVGIIGTNGSGKSTLLKIITGVLNPTQGSVEVNGKISALLELGAGFNPEYTGIENIYLNGTMMGYTKGAMDKKIADIVDFADIGDFINQPVKTYSSGMFVRLAFAVAINVEPEVLIVDEALSVGDYRFQAKCYAKIEDMKKTGATILLVTHDVDSVRKFCDRCIWIEKGVIQEIGDVKPVTSHYLAFTNSSHNENNTNIVNEEIEVTEATGIELYPELKPINRWGEYPNIIKHVMIYNTSQEIVEHIELKEEFCIKVICEVRQEEIQKHELGIAVAIKNNKGQDLIVIDTFRDKIKLNRAGRYCIVFKLKNYFIQGEYYIVASCESREQAIPTYLDHVDGAYHFKVIGDKCLYGMLNVPFNVQVEKRPN
ncbi:ABC transporter ATP-binding protein [Niameybacter massiliensis]|uniref:ABC transporter ATP-binding protein n=1 Tax=Holtiella tumoricola TaxID=3018743 RepID=A0AA42J2H9_9FIRM|nr:ABC transporter ATP-binding protein [Holtiella tumoricola]MDA3733218.1 ABC transporter ATP-binding protein [Holtiella tumoricola]